MIPSTIDVALRERGLRVTPQRLAIAAVLREIGGHVTAEQLRARLDERMPGVSLPTVYATLDILEELGYVRRVAAAGGATVFDARTDAHHHAVCRRCGAIIDLDAPLTPRRLLEAAGSRGFLADETQVLVLGLCAGCRS
jgi:Fe2+ or Zn2+ uptake regulation protein